MDAANYNITVRKGIFEGDECFEARVLEFPDLAEYADSHEEAYLLAIDSIEVTTEIFVEKGKQIPLPMSPADDFSGRVTLRLPKTLHRSLAQVSEQEGVSLNQHLLNILNFYSGYAQGAAAVRPEENHWQPKSETKIKRVSNARPKLIVVSTSKLQQQEKYG
jgi:predicted HicB family RNase H-like nuclease